MINDNLIKLAEVLDKLCVEGYNTIDKSDILDCLENDFNIKLDASSLDEEIKFLCENKFVVLKYSDDMVYCLSFTEAGIELVNKIKIVRQNEENTKKSKKQSKNIEGSTNMPLATSVNMVESKQNAILTSLTPEIVNKKLNFGKLKSFLIGLIGGILGGGISGAIIVLCVLFL
ncbi:MAG: hypothetical protein K2P12_00660 [Clostridia bacterium]|nr:hypothetical protein [Clostridia bacterium]